jgi:hypothetical protein
MQPLREEELLAKLRSVGLDHTKARAVCEVETEPGQHRKRQRGQRDAPVDEQQRHQSHQRRHHVARPARELPSDQVLHRRRVVHHAGGERPRLRLVEVRGGQARHVRHDPATPAHHHAFGREPEHAREREHGDRLHDGRAHHRHGEPREEIVATPADHVVEQHLGCDRDDEPRRAIDDEQSQPERELLALAPHDLAREVPGRPLLPLAHRRRICSDEHGLVRGAPDGRFSSGRSAGSACRACRRT